MNRTIVKDLFKQISTIGMDFNKLDGIRVFCNDLHFFVRMMSDHLANAVDDQGNGSEEANTSGGTGQSFGRPWVNKSVFFVPRSFAKNCSFDSMWRNDIQWDNSYYQKAHSMLGSDEVYSCLLYTSPSPRDQRGSRMPSSA